MFKKYLFLSALFVFTLLNSMGQSIQNYAGIWEGKLNVGAELRIVFHISENEHGGLTAVADSPDQSAFGLTCDTTFVSNEKLVIEMHDLRASFSGKLINDSTLDGTFNQGADFALVLKRVSKPSEKNRPQTPKPPFSYRSEEVEYTNAGTMLKYGATITIPQAKGPFPAVLLITGSGPQDRNETLFDHRPFAVLADYLSSNGIVVLRVDDRGVGKSSGVFSDATTADFANDVNAGVDYLLKRPEVNKQKIGLIGHSEGGMIAPMVATQRKDIDFIVLLAGPGIKITDLLAEQNEAVYRSMKISEPAIKAYSSFYKKLMTETINTADSTKVADKAVRIIEDFMAKTDTSFLKELNLHSAKAKEQLLSNLLNSYSGKWIKYFVKFDPQPYLQKINCKVLALNGDKDVQVIASSNLAGIEKALKKSKSKNYTVKALPGLNHLFQTCTTCTIAEYGILEETFSPKALNEIGSWLDKHVIRN